MMPHGLTKYAQTANAPAPIAVRPTYLRRFSRTRMERSTRLVTNAAVRTKKERDESGKRTDAPASKDVSIRKRLLIE